MAITLRQMTYFAALAEHRTFNRAAEACHVSQPALSVQIRELEDRLGDRLVERGARGAVLTRFGREVLARVKRTLAAARDVEAAAYAHGVLSGTLRLGLIPTVAPYLLPGVAEGLRARDLTLDIRVIEAKTDRLVAELADGEIDAAVLAIPAGGDKLCHRPLASDRFLLAGSRRRIAEFDLAAPQPGALGPDQLLLLEDGHCLSDQALEICARDRMHDRIEMTASSLSTLVRMSAAGFGLTLVPETAVAVESAGLDDLALRRFAEPQPERRLGLFRRRATPETGWFSDLADIVADAARTAIAAA